MTARPWMPLDIEDYLSDTAHLTTLEHGAYLLLIMRYWRDGGLPANEMLIARYAGLSPEQWSQCRDVLAAFFEDGWKHRRIEAELARANEVMEKRRASGRVGGSTRQANAKQTLSERQHTNKDKDLSPSLRSGETRASARASPPVAGFDAFWTEFPNKVGKRDAERAFERAAGRVALPELMAGLRRYVAKTDDRPWCNPATWLNQDRWADQPAAVVPPARGSPERPPNALDLLRDQRRTIIDADPSPERPHLLAAR